MKATYEKVTNLIVVELSAEEGQQYCSKEISERNRNLRMHDSTYYLTIPCGSRFWNMTQRRRGGAQSWGPEELRQAIRAAVANRLVSWKPETQQDFREYKSAWNKVFQGLLRQVRLKFPNGKHPRQRLSRQEYQFRKNWRAQYVVK